MQGLKKPSATPQEIEEAAEAKAVKDELDDILKILTSQLNDFDK